MRINDDWWEFYLITEEEADDLSDGFRGMTDDSQKCMFIVEGQNFKNILSHELLHLYSYYFCTDSAGITKDQYEELVAEFLEHHLDKFIKTRNKLVKRFEKLNEVGRKK